MADQPRTLDDWTTAIAEEAAHWRSYRTARGYPHPDRRLRQSQSALKLGLMMRQAYTEHPEQHEAISLALLNALGLDEPPEDSKPASWRSF